MQVAAIATGIATTESEITARNDALSQLPSVSNTFLEASRTMFASSGQYILDFNSVLDVLTNTSTAIEAQLSDAELQLRALEENTLILDVIRDNTLTTSELLSQLVLAQAVTSTASQDYSMNLNMLTAQMLSRASLTTDLMQTMLASMSLIAPSLQGITAANDSSITPTMSIPLTPDRAMATTASNDALVAQVAALTAEVAGLRADQQAQTGDLIATNYDATQLVVDSNEETSVRTRETMGWDYRSRFLLA